MKILILQLLLLFMYPGKRELFIFYNQGGITLKDKQLAELDKDKDGLAERNIAIHTYQTDIEKKEVRKWHIDAAKAFTIILVGKDGGEKLRSDSMLTLTRLFGTIDAMPMRKTEMSD